MVSKSCRWFEELDLNIGTHDPPRVTLELQVLDDVTILGEAKLLMSYGTHELLTEWGWTPPEIGKGVRDE